MVTLNSIRNLTFFLFLIFSTCSGQRINYSDFFKHGLDGQVEYARDAFEITYYHLLEQGLFPFTYNNSLIINPDLTPDSQQEGTIILKLIDWLEKQDDKDCCLLLERLTDLYCLEFQRSIALMDLKKKAGAQLLSCWQNLYQIQVSKTYGSTSIKVSPFRSALSKIYIVTTIINDSNVSYDSRKETLLFLLDTIKRDMLEINLTLDIDPVDELIVQSLTSLVAIHGVREPIVESHTLRKVVLISFAAVAIGLFIYHVILPNKQKIKSWLSTFGKELGINVFEPIGEGLYTGMRTAAAGDIAIARTEIDERFNEQQLNIRIQSAVRDAIRSIAQDQQGQPNPDLTVIGNQIAAGITAGITNNQQVNQLLNLVQNEELFNQRIQNAINNAIHGVAQNNQGQTNPDLSAIGTQLAAGMIDGIAQNNQGQANPNLSAIGNQLAGGIISGIARDNQNQPNPNITLIGNQLAAAIINGIARDNQNQPNPNITLIGNQIAAAIISGIARDNQNQPNPNITLIGNQIASAIISAIAQNDQGQPNPQVALIANQLLHGALVQQPHQVVQNQNGEAQPPQVPTNPDLTQAAQDVAARARQGASQNAGWIMRTILGSPQNQQQQQSIVIPNQSPEEITEQNQQPVEQSNDSTSRGGWFHW